MADLDFDDVPSEPRRTGYARRAAPGTAAPASGPRAALFWAGAMFPLAVILIGGGLRFAGDAMMEPGERVLAALGAAETPATKMYQIGTFVGYAGAALAGLATCAGIAFTFAGEANRGAGVTTAGIAVVAVFGIAATFFPTIGGQRDRDRIREKVKGQSNPTPAPAKNKGPKPATWEDVNDLGGR